MEHSPQYQITSPIAAAAAAAARTYYDDEKNTLNRILMNYAAFNGEAATMFSVASFFANMFYAFSLGSNSGPMEMSLVFLLFYILAAGSTDRMDGYDIKYAVFLQCLSLICVVPVMMIKSHSPKKNERRRRIVNARLGNIAIVITCIGSLLGVVTSGRAILGSVYVIIGVQMVVISLRDILPRILTGALKEKIDALGEMGILRDLTDIDYHCKNSEKAKEKRNDEKNVDEEAPPENKSEKTDVDNAEDKFHSSRSEEFNYAENATKGTTNDAETGQKQTPSAEASSDDMKTSKKMITGNIQNLRSMKMPKSMPPLVPKAALDEIERIKIAEKSPLATTVATILLSFFSSYFSGITGCRSLPFVTIILRALQQKIPAINDDDIFLAVSSVSVGFNTSFRFVYYLFHTSPQTTFGYFLSSHWPIYVCVMIFSIAGILAGDFIAEKKVLNSDWLMVMMSSFLMLSGFMSFVLAGST